MTALLASVADVDEAALALAGGADILDLKNPSEGALGAWPLPALAEAVRRFGGRRPLSATIGDLPLDPPVVAARVRTVADTAVDIVKIGMFPGDLDGTLGALEPLARSGVRLVAVLLADRNPPLLRIADFARAGFLGVMLDTADKRAGPLRAHLPGGVLADFVERAHASGLLAGLAGSLAAADIPVLAPLGPDYLGFRGALCVNGRSGRLDPSRLAALRTTLARFRRPGEQQPGDREGRCHHRSLATGVADARKVLEPQHRSLQPPAQPGDEEGAGAGRHERRVGAELAP